LICPGRHTISGLITTFGKQFRDWSADYALYAKSRVNEDVIFSQIRREVESLTPPDRPLCLALDDTILRKTGKTIPGAAYRKDPLGPPFNLNLVWAQRRIQFSAALADANSEVRMIPISFRDASTPRKPRKTAPPEDVEIYKERMKQRNHNTLASECSAASPRRPQRPSTQDLINELRRELWANAIRPEVLTDFMNTAHGNTKPLKFTPNLCSSLFAATA
jgi:hypothetical protein